MHFDGLACRLMLRDGHLGRSRKLVGFSRGAAVAMSGGGYGRRRADSGFGGIDAQGQRRRQVLGAGWWDAEEMRMWPLYEGMSDDGKVPLSQTSGMIALGQTKWK